MAGVLMTDTNVIPLRPRADAPVQTILSLRRAALEGGAGMEAARRADREAKLRGDIAAAEVLEAYKINLRAVDAETRAEWATRIREAVRMLEAVGAEVKRAEVLPSSVMLFQLTGILEAEAARLDPVCDLPEGA